MMMTTSRERERVIGESIFLLLGLLRDSKGKRGVMSHCNAIIFCMRMYIGVL